MSMPAPSRSSGNIPFPSRAARFGAVAFALAAAFAVLAAAGQARAAIYSQTITLPVPPASTFATSGGGDGWDVALSNDKVFNVFHHDSNVRINCHNQSDATTCWPIRTITDGSSAFQTGGHPGLYLDQSTGKLYVYATRSANLQGGVVCIDTVNAATNPNPFCGFVPLTGAGEADSIGFGLLSSPMLASNKLYSFNFVANTGPGGPSGTGAQNRLLCFDVASKTACAGQPFSVNVGGGASMISQIPAPDTAAVGTRLFIPVRNDAFRMACFDTATQADCAGAWPVATGPVAGNSGPVIPRLSIAGVPTGVCLANASGQCLDFTGASVPTPANLTSVITQTTVWQGPAVTLGPRVYVPNGNQGNVVQCYDYSTSSSCPGFPKAFNGLGFIYTINKDPQRPTCLWVNADNGPQQIQSFDAFSGGACGAGSIRVLAAQFVVPQDKCLPNSYVSLQIVAPARASYSSGTVDFLNGAGNPLGIPSASLDASGSVDLTGLALNSATGTPQFVITLNGAPINLGQVQVKLTWINAFDPSCVGNSQVTKEPTAITTGLAGGGMSGTSITVQPGTAVVDTAVLTGANAALASGSVTYTWFSDSSCQTIVSGGSAQAITTPGVIPPSPAVTLAPGTYYAVAAYSGDSGNLPSQGRCGDEILQVRSPDADHDGVLDSEDLCPNTPASDLASGVPSRGLGTNRWADLNGDGVFETTASNGKGPGLSFTLHDTHGCSCAQLITRCGYGTGFTMFGCSISAMRAATSGGCDAN
ncbi:MAG TPA: Ig-like domain-containing protein [Polyangia bacterium]|nr:Ig-like domain-containing protein [Polyangia bacterium]